MLGIEGQELTSADRARLTDPRVGGAILFRRNYASPTQLLALTNAIGSLRDPPLLIAVDHEGGRVQRFQDGFTTIPPMRELGEHFDRDRDGALVAAERWGRLIAAELRACGVDFSFTPVLDLDAGTSAVIGHRAFHPDAHVIGAVAGALCRGLHAGGMAAVGKHFPGHGNVASDSHVELPIDPRPFDEIAAYDLVPFAELSRARLLDAVMPAHVLYPAFDSKPAGFSSRWLKDVLREQLGFDGAIFSDDLEMAGAHGAGDIVMRAEAAGDAGCDMVLVCNDFSAMDALLARWSPTVSAKQAERMERMRRRA